MHWPAGPLNSRWSWEKARFIGLLSFLRMPNKRRVLHENLQAAFPLETKSRIRGVVCRRFIAEKINDRIQDQMDQMSDAQLKGYLESLDVQGEHHLKQAYATGRPVILVSPHYGNFMLAALFVATRYAHKGVYFFYNPPERNTYAERSNKLLDRPSSHCHKIYNNAHGLKTALQALKANGTLCMMPDIVSHGGATLHVPLLGRFYSVMTGTAYFALRSRATIVPLFCRQISPSKTVIECRPALPEPFGIENHDDQLYWITLQLFREFEQQFKKHPEHWRYWHSFLKRSVPGLTPPSTQQDLLQYLCNDGLKHTQNNPALSILLKDWIKCLDPQVSPVASLKPPLLP